MTTTHARRSPDGGPTRWRYTNASASAATARRSASPSPRLRERSAATSASPEPSRGRGESAQYALAAQAKGRRWLMTAYEARLRTCGDSGTRVSGLGRRATIVRSAASRSGLQGGGRVGRAFDQRDTHTRCSFARRPPAVRPRSWDRWAALSTCARDRATCTSCWTAGQAGVGRARSGGRIMWSYEEIKLART